MIFSVGKKIIARNGAVDGFWIGLWDLLKHPRNLFLLSTQRIVGLSLFVTGLSTMLVAQITLRRFYSATLVIREGHRLITHGIYRFTRHPIYLGAITILVVGLPLFASSLYGFLVMFALIPIVFIRIRMEERLLTEEFGDAYRAYQETTSKLIPFIY